MTITHHDELDGLKQIGRIVADTPSRRHCRHAAGLTRDRRSMTGRN